MFTAVMTAPRDKVPKKYWKIIMEEYDVKDWIIALEIGKSGYVHWQIRMDISGDYDTFFQRVHTDYKEIHIEKGNARVYETPYERKGGRFVCNRDKLEALKCRFGNLNEIQQEFIRTLDSQSVREVDVWLDPIGSKGKSFFSVHMADTGQALYVPSSEVGSGQLESFIVHNWQGEDYIIIDIPRSGKIPETIYETIERIKDGWIVSTKWQGRTANVRGTKLAVFTNKPLDTSKLSRDRWRLHGIARARAPYRNTNGALFPPLKGGGNRSRFNKGGTTAERGDRLRQATFNGNRQIPFCRYHRL